MTPKIKDFAPNTAARSTAEVLAGLMGLGIITDWDHEVLQVTEKSVTDVFLVKVPKGDPSVVPMSSEQVKWFAKGVLVARSKYRESLLDQADTIARLSTNLAEPERENPSV